MSDHWLRLARGAWLLLAAVGVAILLTSLPGYFRTFSGELAHISPQIQDNATAILARLSGIASLGTALLSLTLAGLFFRRRFAEPVVATLSFYLLVYGVVMAGPLETWSAYWVADNSFNSLVIRLQGLLIAAPTVALFAIFPNGRFVPGWSRSLVNFALLLSAIVCFLPSHNPAEMEGWAANLLILLTVGLIGVFGAGLYAQFYRYRHVSSPTERQQTKWVVYGFTLWLIYILLSSFPYYYLENLPADAPVPWWGSVSVLGWFVTLSIVPVCLTVAVTRYRLWEIDIIINRTLVYGVLTAVVISLYVLVVGGMSALFQTQGNWLITLAATGLVAVLFQPIRDRLQRSVNRLLYGRRDEPFAVLAGLGQRLEDTMSPESVYPTIVETVAQTLKLPYAALQVKKGDDMVRVVSTGEPGTGTKSFPLTYQGVCIGELLVAHRGAEEEFSAKDEQLLRNLARQAGTAVHALQLRDDLQHARQQIITSREEERRRLRRDLHDGLGPSLAAQMLKIGSARAMLSEKPEVTDRLLAEMEQDIENTLADVRRIVYNLRPPALDQWGLAGALRAYAESCESADIGTTQTRLAIRVDAPDALPPLPAAVEVAAYHIGREALTNVVHHAQAAHCHLRLRIDEGKNGRLHLNIQDDGLGFADKVVTGVGLTAMRERAAELGGSCTIMSRPGAGTQVTAVLPLGSNEITHV